MMTDPIRPRGGKQVAAARVLANVTQKQLANSAGLHVNSVRYLERQPVITTWHSSERVAKALADDFGVVFFTAPTWGVRLRDKDELYG
jgi:hypothetical protein